jgi:CBS domain-containing protein
MGKIKKFTEIRREVSTNLFSMYNNEDNSLFSLKFVKDVMIQPVLLHPDDDADTIMKKLKKEDTNVCIVVTKENKFIGEIGVEDLIKFFLHQVKYEPLAQTLNVGYKREFLYKSAKDLINKHKSTVKIDDSINKVIELIYKEGFNYIPVLDKNKKVLGVVTPSSLISFLQR